MVEFNVPHDIAIDEFIDNHVTEHFTRSAENADTSAMMGKEFTLQYNIGDAKYCLHIKDGDKLEIIKGGVDTPMLSLHMEESNWRDYISGKIDAGLDRFIDPTQLYDHKRYSALLEFKGTLFLKLRRDDGETLVATICFNGAESPSATLKLKIPDWIGLQTGKKKGPMLFMTGKMKAGGDMGFIMKCQALM
ncbi:MAG: SCP2 sterol-binding domain-containing protein [Deltaproteobacteria bacterium]|nr:SCP2 sterol-binding domain-containing protein [Deltaproteobacteria bacterium]